MNKYLDKYLKYKLKYLEQIKGGTSAVNVNGYVITRRPIPSYGINEIGVRDKNKDNILFIIEIPIYDSPSYREIINIITDNKELEEFFPKLWNLFGERINITDSSSPLYELIPETDIDETPKATNIDIDINGYYITKRAYLSLRINEIGVRDKNKGDILFIIKLPITDDSSYTAIVNTIKENPELEQFFPKLWELFEENIEITKQSLSRLIPDEEETPKDTFTRPTTNIRVPQIFSSNIGGCTSIFKNTTL
jgi:hypothetical protein